MAEAARIALVALVLLLACGGAGPNRESSAISLLEPYPGWEHVDAHDGGDGVSWFRVPDRVDDVRSAYTQRLREQGWVMIGETRRGDRWVFSLVRGRRDAQRATLFVEPAESASYIGVADVADLRDEWQWPSAGSGR